MSGPRMLSTRAPRVINSQGALEVLHPLGVSLPHPGREAKKGEGASSSSLSPVAPQLQRAFWTQRLQLPGPAVRSPDTSLGSRARSRLSLSPSSRFPPQHMPTQSFLSCGPFPGKPTDVNGFVQVPASWIQRQVGITLTETEDPGTERKDCQNLYVVEH